MSNDKPLLPKEWHPFLAGLLAGVLSREFELDAHHDFIVVEIGEPYLKRSYTVKLTISDIKLKD